MAFCNQWIAWGLIQLFLIFHVSHFLFLLKKPLCIFVFLQSLRLSQTDSFPLQHWVVLFNYSRRDTWKPELARVFLSTGSAQINKQKVRTSLNTVFRISVQQISFPSTNGVGVAIQSWEQKWQIDGFNCWAIHWKSPLGYWEKCASCPKSADSCWFFFHFLLPSRHKGSFTTVGEPCW